MLFILEINRLAFVSMILEEVGGSKKRSLRTLKGDADNLRGGTWRNIVIVGKQCDENVR